MNQDSGLAITFVSIFTVSPHGLLKEYTIVQAIKITFAVLTI